MTTQDVERAIEKIMGYYKPMACYGGRPTWDDGTAHGLEDDLYIKVLTAIAQGNNKPQDLAKAALQTQELEFSRWTE